jgi:hypothetical protein
VYISQDAIFDELAFPFSKLHSNVVAWLRSEISLLPLSLLDNMSFGGIIVDLDHVPKSTNPHVQPCLLQESQHAPDQLIVSPGDPYFLTCDVHNQAPDPVDVGNPRAKPGLILQADSHRHPLWIWCSDLH